MSNVFSTIVVIEDTVNKHVREIEDILLRIPTVGRLTSWSLFTQRGRGVELGTKEVKSR